MTIVIFSFWLSVGQLTKDGSASSEILNSHPSGLAKQSPPLSSSSSSLSHATALHCISFLSEEDRVTSEGLFKSSPSAKAKVDSWLAGLDRGEVGTTVHLSPFSCSFS